MATINTYKWKLATTDSGHYHKQYWTFSQVSVIKGCLRRLMAMRHIRFYPQCKVKASFDVLRVAKCEFRAFICLDPAPCPSCQLQHGGR